KLLVVFILLLFVSFAQRFQRHSINGTQNGYTNDNTEIDNLDALSSDGENAVQNGADVKFVGDSGKVGLEMVYNELKFKFCSDGCMDQKVIVCYDCENTDETLRGDCDLNQCGMIAGVEKDDKGMASQRKNLL
uniref:Uncharacterized protein n=1 Tax=Panagrolaimus sp. PS1159 TaxID=55785 RepID=A0AC35GEK4_9BILA